MTDATVVSNISDNPNMRFNNGQVSGASVVYQDNAADVTNDGTPESND